MQALPALPHQGETGDDTRAACGLHGVTCGVTWRHMPRRATVCMNEQITQYWYGYFPIGKVLLKDVNPDPHASVPLPSPMQVCEWILLPGDGAPLMPGMILTTAVEFFQVLCTAASSRSRFKGRCQADALDVLKIAIRVELPHLFIQTVRFMMDSCETLDDCPDAVKVRVDECPDAVKVRVDECLEATEERSDQRLWP